MIRTAALLCAVLTNAPSALAQSSRTMAPRDFRAIPTDAEAVQQSQAFRGSMVCDGRDLNAAVRKVVKELPWHERLTSAQEAAKQSGRPIFWLQLLGDLDGYT